MHQIDFHKSNNYSVFLEHPNTEGKKSQIYIDFYPTPDFMDEFVVIEYLKNKAPTPLLLSKCERENNVCIKVKSIMTPKIIFGFSPPSNNPDNDLNEILEWLKSSNIPVKLI